MKAHKMETILSEDGILILKGLPILCPKWPASLLPFLSLHKQTFCTDKHGSFPLYGQQVFRLETL